MGPERTRVPAPPLLPRTRWGAEFCGGTGTVRSSVIAHGDSRVGKNGPGAGYEKSQ
ncbi:hypothetical protein SCOCK_570008 [Actinacidiphila cocklensis]|uniref:Uncharacterized protein n=1 Tax=Actinacidiphila cocklensis TaxID=887465 RepID=A0A9W4GWA8_9ACTN|nr:hypothetical protein SCOCK_570008 [Actinacidiphila cocklensis]